MLQSSNIFLLVAALLSHLALFHFCLLSKLNEDPGKGRPHDGFFWVSRLFAARFLHRRLNNYALPTIVPPSILSFFGVPRLVSKMAMVLAKRACVSSAISVARKQPFDSLDELRSRNVQSICEFKNGCKRWAIFAAFEKADVFGMVAALECEGFLRQFAFVAQLKQDPCERTFFPRVRFVSSRHAQHGVCNQSTNSSTKYSIHFVKNGLQLAVGEFGRLESLKRNRVSRRTRTRTNKLSSISRIVGSQEQF